MIRQSAARCLCLRAPSATGALRTGFRTLVASAPTTVAAPLRAVRPFNMANSSLAMFTRSMSSQSGTAEADADQSAPADKPTKFTELEGRVHPNIIKAFIDDMGYVNMTPVQAQTIGPGLAGKDL